jgi:hypothetical protein
LSRKIPESVVSLSLPRRHGETPGSVCPGAYWLKSSSDASLADIIYGGGGGWEGVGGGCVDGCLK